MIGLFHGDSITSLAQIGFAQQSVHPTLGIRRYFQAFFYASAFFQSDGVLPPAPARVTQTVRQPVLIHKESLNRKLGLIIDFRNKILFLSNVIAQQKNSMKKLTTPLSLFLLFVLPFLGLLVGARILKLTTERASPRWEQLTSPLKFTKIEDANPFAVWTRDADNKLYFWKLECGRDPNAKCDQWIATESVPDNAHEDMPLMRKGSTCPDFGDIQPKGLRKEVIECVLGASYNLNQSGSYFALLEDGTIWYRSLPSSGGEVNLNFLIYLCGGFLLGLAVAGILVVIIRDLSSKGS